ncbi:MAG: DUF86 domain-containing protein [Candidatus Aminicenantes bacterium]|nr:DUF86 domain-containing protein [Candidatus Aminicenantes bacterium]
MTPALLREKVISERILWIREMMAGLRSLPLESLDAFRSDARNTASAESYLRRALEALLDLGRHILAKGFGNAVPEYKEVAKALLKFGVIGPKESDKLRILAGYRNRMVHFYHEISDLEIYEICTRELGDVEAILSKIINWINNHPAKIDKSL